MRYSKPSNSTLFCHIVVFVFAFFHLSAGAQQPLTADVPPAEWTMMFYMDSDNDLEGAQMNDLDEMLAIGGTAKVNIVVLADRSLKGENDDEDNRKYTNRPVGGLRSWTTAKLLVVEKGKLREIADWGEINMGDPANLKRFLQTVMKDFPAKRFGLVFGDHGSGWQGIVGDESHQGDSLSMLELPVALKGSTAAGKLDLIGFDACLMANFEAAKAIGPYGKVMVASEELEPGNGWHYTPLFGTLINQPAIDGFALGKIIVDTYRAFYLGSNQGHRDATVTLSVIDLTRMPALEAAISSLGTNNRAFMKSGGRTTWLKTAQARGSSEAYGNDGEFFDLLDYAVNIKAQRPDAETVKAADAVAAAVKASVVYKINGSARPRSSGMSIYFPPKRDVLLGSGYEKTPSSLTGKWFPFIGEFSGIQVADTQAPKIEKVATTDPDIAAADVVTVSAQVNADDVEEATFVLAETDDDGEVIIGAIPTGPDEKGVLKEEWDGTWFSIGNEDKELICPVTDFEEIEEDVFLIEIPAQIRFRGGRAWRDITMYFVLDLKQDEPVGEFVNAFEFTGNQAREVFLGTGDAVRPVYVAIDKDGNAGEIASDDPADILQIKRADGLTIGNMDVAAGKYLVGFVVSDFAGNTDEGFVEVTLE